jgi:pimeloyl-ACP methyl ester carboxylesterase
MSQHPTRTVRVGHIDLNVIDTALSEPPGATDSTVLLLHGFPDRASMWDQEIEMLLSAGHRVLAPDLRGFGESTRPDGVEEYSADRVLGDVLGLLDSLGIDKVKLGAHDFGALIAWLLAATAPERVDRLAAVSVGHPRAFGGAGPPQKQLSWYQLWFQFEEAETLMAADDWKWFRTWAYRGINRCEDVSLDRQLTDLERPGALRAGLNYYRANIRPESFASTEPFDWVPNVGCPVLGVWGAQEMALTEKQMQDSQKYVDGEWRYERFEDVGHWIPAHASRRLGELLVDFFA